METKNIIGLGYMIYSVLSIVGYLVFKIDWLFFQWFIVLFICGIISYFILDYRRDKRIRELENKLDSFHK